MQKLTFDSHGYKLNTAVFYPPVKKEKYPAILFVQGWTGKKERSYQYATGLSQLGYLCFLFDARGHGKSEGDINSFTIREFLDDVLAAYDYLIDIDGVDKENISAVGSSFGGYLIALLSTKKNIKNLTMRVPADYPNEDLDKLKTTSSHEDKSTMTWRRKQKQPSETYALDALSKFTGNVLIIEAELDNSVPHQTIENYKNAVKDKSKLTYAFMAGAPHSINEGKFRDDVEHILVEWFKDKI